MHKKAVTQRDRDRRVESKARRWRAMSFEAEGLSIYDKSKSCCFITVYTLWYMKATML